MIKYKGYEIDQQGNGWGYYEATNTNDCDAPIIYADSVEKVIIEIDEHHAQIIL